MTKISFYEKEITKQRQGRYSLEFAAAHKRNSHHHRQKTAKGTDQFHPQWTKFRIAAIKTDKGRDHNQVCDRSCGRAKRTQQEWWLTA